MKIVDFLGVGIGEHTKKGCFFNPEFSIKNMNVFNNFTNDKSAISFIERELKNWIYLFPDESNSTTLADLNSYTFL